MLNILLCSVIPLITVIFSVVFTNAAGPYWLAPNNDPAYFYFFNSLYLLDKLPLYPTTHPGLTLDLIGAFTFKLFHPELSHQDLFLAIIKNPEFYLHVIHYIMVFMYVASLAFLGWIAYKKSGDILFTMLLQSGSLLVLAVPANTGLVLPVIAHVKPETLLVTAVNLLMIGLLKCYWDKDARSPITLALYMGFICALGVFSKYTFILFPFFVFFILRGISGRCWFILGFVVFGYLFSLVETDPYNRILIWVKDLVFKSGFTGGMSDKFIEPGVYMSALADLIVNNLYVFVITGGVFVVAIFKRDRLLWLVSTCVLAQFLMVARHPNPHYMVPAVGLFGLVFALLYEKFRQSVSRKIVAVFIALFMAVNIISLIHYAVKLSECNSGLLRYAQNVNAAHEGYVICPYYQSSSPMFVLAFYTNNMHTYYNELLKKLYPDYYYYDFNAHDFKDFLGRWVPLSEIKSGHKGVLLYGSGGGEDSFKPYTLVHQVDRSPQGEGLYEVLTQHSPHAAEYFQISLMLYMKGQFQQALMYGLYSKELGLPHDIDGYLARIILQLKSGAGHE